MNIDPLHLIAFAPDSCGAAALAVGAVHTLTLATGDLSHQAWPFAGHAGIGPAVAPRAGAPSAAAGLTLTFKVPISA